MVIAGVLKRASVINKFTLIVNVQWFYHQFKIHVKRVAMLLAFWARFLKTLE